MADPLIVYESPSPPPDRPVGTGTVLKRRLLQAATEGVARGLAPIVGPTIGRAVPEFFLPQTETELLIDLATFPAGGPIGTVARRVAARTGSKALTGLAGLGARVGAQAGGGAVGATLEGEPATRGAVRGVATGLTGEAVGKLFEKLVGIPMTRGLLEQVDLRRFVRVLPKVAPDFPTAKSAADLTEIIVGTLGQDAMREGLRQRTAQVAQSLGNTPILSETFERLLPGLGSEGMDILQRAANRVATVTGRSVAGAPPGPARPSFRFEDLVEALPLIRKRTFAPTGAPKTGETAIDLMTLREQAIGEFKQQMPPGAVAAFDTALREYRRHARILDVLSENAGELLTPQGGVNLGVLMRTVGGDPDTRRELQRAFLSDPKKLEAFFRVVFRGGQPFERDVPGHLPVRIGTGNPNRPPSFFLGLPKFPELAGDLPAAIRVFANPRELLTMFGAVPLSKFVFPPVTAPLPVSPSLAPPSRRDLP